MPTRGGLAGAAWLGRHDPGRGGLAGGLANPIGDDRPPPAQLRRIPLAVIGHAGQRVRGSSCHGLGSIAATI
jgi:hypothetical protein